MVRHQPPPPCLCLCPASLSCISHLFWIHSHSQSPHSEASIWSGDGACYFSTGLSLNHPHSPDREEERLPVTYWESLWIEHHRQCGSWSSAVGVLGEFTLRMCHLGHHTGEIPTASSDFDFSEVSKPLLIVRFKVKLIYRQSAHSQDILTS